MKLHKSVATTIISCTLVLLNSHAIAEQKHASVAQCGHEHNDSFELRSQAHHKISWRDHRGLPSKYREKAFTILGINDFHGGLETTRRVADRPVGGAAVLAAYLKEESEQAKNGTMIVHAGDHVGASPPISALLQDEPSISFLNLLANKHCKYTYKRRPRCNIVGTPGNHEFDEGLEEMLRLINGGNHPDGPFLEKYYRGAKFPYVSANVVNQTNNKPVLPPYTVRYVRGIPVAFIGAVLKETPSIVTPSGIAGLKFLDEATSINYYVRKLKRWGIRAFVVTIHQGTRQQIFDGPTQDDPFAIEGAIGNIILNLDDNIDVVVSGHAHGFTNQLMKNKNGKEILVTQAFAAGTAYSKIDIKLDSWTRDVVEKSAQIKTVWADEGPGLEPDAEVAAMVERAGERVEPLVNRIIGHAETAITRDESDAGESALGNLIADAQRQATGSHIALMNPGGIRAGIIAGDVTWGDLFTVQPFGNDLVTMELTGQQIIDLLNQQWSGANTERTRILKPSGIQYHWDASLPAENRVDIESVVIDGQVIDLQAVYTVTVNSFIASGGDNFTVLTQGTNRVIGLVDLDALVEYIQQLPQPFNAQIEGRITRSDG